MSGPVIVDAWLPGRRSCGFLWWCPNEDEAAALAWHFAANGGLFVQVEPLELEAA